IAAGIGFTITQRKFESCEPHGLSHGRLSRAPMSVETSVPAPIDVEFGRTTLIDPHAGAVRAPVAPFDAGAVRHLSRDRNPPGPAKIDGAEAVLEVLALAGDIEARIPTRPRLPAIAIMTPVLIDGLVLMVGMMSATGCGKASCTAAVHPKSALIDPPVLAANASRVGQLLDQARIVPGNAAAGPAHVAALTLDSVAVTVVLCANDGSWRGENQYQCS